MSSAVLSDCELYRWRLDRDVQDEGIVFAYFGVNGATADGEKNDQTVRKWNGFTMRNGGRRYIVGNAFGYRATNVATLAAVGDPVGIFNDAYLAEIIMEADVLVPCWGAREKLPDRLHYRLDYLRELIFLARKPVRVFGFTKSGDPKHPLTLGYETPLALWGG